LVVPTRTRCVVARGHHTHVVCRQLATSGRHATTTQLQRARIGTQPMVSNNIGSERPKVDPSMLPSGALDLSVLCVSFGNTLHDLSKSEPSGSRLTISIIDPEPPRHARPEAGLTQAIQSRSEPAGWDGQRNQIGPAECSQVG
jgi:hypothetical protein